MDRAQIIEEMGLGARDELAFQEVLLAKAESDLETGSSELDFIRADLEGMRSWRYKLAWRVCKCCLSEESVATRAVRIVETDDHLPHDQVERLWRKRFDPQEKWIQQMEAQLDRLIELAEELEAMLVKQEQKAKRMGEKGAAVRTQLRKTKKTLAEIV